MSTPLLLNRFGMDPPLESWDYADAWVRALQPLSVPDPLVRFYRRSVSPRGYSRIEEAELWLPWSCACALIGSGVTAGSADGQTVTTGSYDTTGANLAVMIVADYSIISLPNISDNKSNTWTARTSYTDGNFTVEETAFYTQGGTFGSGHTFTASGFVNYPAITVFAFSGAASSPFDAENGASAGAGGTSLQTGNVTPSADGVLVAGIAFSNSNTHSIDLSFSTPLETDYHATVNNFGVGGSYLISSSGVGKNPTWSWTNSGGAAVGLYGFKAAAGGFTTLNRITLGPRAGSRSA